ncbi:MAG: selenide, water dikinase SelD, partial [Candidatus Accumulibacter sp.]|nr:selenide, water dikinase SelD [Accumulibacter sp.]
MDEIRLTRFSHGGGCGCKIAPGLLAEMLRALPRTSHFPDLLVGAETADDAAVYRLNDTQALVATTDFFMPIVDDPFDFGRIAATNALSDIYAMGGRPILALSIVGMPIDALPMEVIQRILAGGASVCEQAGIPLAGGHSIDAPEPIYGLVALGLAHPERVKRNSRARDGDVLILGKPLGIGILGSAMKKGVLDADAYRQLIDTATQLNTIGAELAAFDGVHALTDVTGFGLLGHLLELCRGARLGARVESDSLPLLPAAVGHARQGIGPGAIARNLDSFGADVSFADAVPDWLRRIMADAQTSGGLLAAVEPSCADEVLARFHAQGFTAAARMGQMRSGPPTISVPRGGDQKT